MKCQNCEKPATFHITELTGSEPLEIHLCEDHARQYLSQPDDSSPGVSLAGAIAQHKVGQTAEDLARLDREACPVCGITFFEFRNQGRLGCPHDYDCFEAHLEPLIINIQGAKEHKGKRPRRAGGDSRPTDLIRLRREMQQAIDSEKYEQASEIRDHIRQIEQHLREKEA
jgi:protein arginine kinase activator